jgi:hypothetical protein
VFLVLAHERRRIVHFAVTAHPAAEWTVQQLREALPLDSAPRYLRRDRDRIFGQDFVDQVKAMDIKQVLSAPLSPWQRACVEQLIGSIRGECLNHISIFGERSLHRALASYLSYYHSWRTHLSLGKDAPQFRRTHPPAEGKVVAIREVGGLHHHYERRPPNSIDHTSVPGQIFQEGSAQAESSCVLTPDFRPLLGGEFSHSANLLVVINEPFGTGFYFLCIFRCKWGSDSI